MEKLKTVVIFMFAGAFLGNLVAQHRLDEDRPAASANAYVSVRCPACMTLHFVNTTTGKLLGDGSGSRPDCGQRSA